MILEHRHAAACVFFATNRATAVLPLEIAVLADPGMCPGDRGHKLD